MDEILKIKIVDPACGSGSFLIKAFSKMCEIVEERLKKGEKSKEWKSTFQEWKEKLSLGEKTTILKNCIYGVDLDEKAVELAQLNLLLKLLEEETRDTKKKILPTMKDNIKNGNSLISDSRFDKAFNWNAQFPDVFRAGGFDVVVGNPPYVRIQTLNKKEVNYFNQNYKTPEKNYDIYILFVEKGYNLLREKGLLGYILPNKFFSADYGKGLRNFLTENKAIKKILDFRDYQVFENATTYTCLLFLSKIENKEIIYCMPKDVHKLNAGILAGDGLSCSLQEQPKQDLTWSFSDKATSEIFNKLDKIKIRLGDVASSIFQGMVTGADRFYFVKVIDEKGDRLIVKNNLKDKKYEIEKEIVKKLLKGKEIRKWHVLWEGYSVLYPYDLKQEKAKLIELLDLKQKYPLFYSYLRDYEKELKSREKNKFKDDKNWHKFGRTQNVDKFKHKKIMTQVLSNSNKFTLDADGEYYFVGGGNAGGYGIILNDEYNNNYEIILGLLNSKVLEFYLKNISTQFRGGYYSYAKRFIERLPIKLPSEPQAQKIKELVERIIQFHKEGRAEQDIKNVDYEIDEEVYKLYGITDEERKVIEESLR